MIKLVLLSIVIADSGNNSLKPDLITVDAFGVEAGLAGISFDPFSVSQYESRIYGLSGNAGRIHFYWGDNLSFLAGIEIVDIGLLGDWISFELVEPRIGFAWIGKPKPAAQTYCCLINPLEDKTFHPKLELVSGINFFPPMLYFDEVFNPAIRTDLRWQPLNGFFIQFQDYWYPVIDVDAHVLFLSIGVSTCSQFKTSK